MIVSGAIAAQRRRDLAQLALQVAALEAARRQAWPVWLWLPRLAPVIESTPSGCGCGRA